MAALRRLAAVVFRPGGASFKKINFLRCTETFSDGFGKISLQPLYSFISGQEKVFGAL